MSAPTIVLLATLLLSVVICKVPAAPVSCSCPAESSLGYCPHPDDCEKFIECNGMAEYILNCPNGTIWYQNIRTCGNGFKKYNCSNSPIGFVCPNDNKTYHADPSDCTGYIECYDTIPYHMPCLPNTIWNQEIETCIFGSC